MIATFWRNWLNDICDLMSNDPFYQQLLELSWRRKLTVAEETRLRAWLAAHPEAESDWEAEAALNQALVRSPDLAVSTNFTARVLEAVRLEEAAVSRGRAAGRRLWWRLHWLPKAALAALIVAAGLVSYQNHQLTKRKALALSVAAVSDVASLPGPDILEDFDAVRALKQTPPADVDLLALLK